MAAPRDERAPAVLVRVDGVTFSYGAQQVLRGASLDVMAGELVALVGPNGAGKSTLLKVMSGVLRPAGGGVFIGGTNVASMPRRDLARLVAVVPQESGFHSEFTVAEVVEMGRLPHMGRFAPPSARDRACIREAMAAVGVAHLASRPVTALSGGQARLVAIARALAQEPRLLLLDEPTAHLDPGHQLSVLALLRRLARRRGLGAVVVLHDLNLASLFADRVAVMRGGVIAGWGRPEAVITPELLRSVYGIAAVVGSHPVTGQPQVFFSPGEVVDPPRGTWYDLDVRSRGEGDG